RPRAAYKQHRHIDCRIHRTGSRWRAIQLGGSSSPWNDSGSYRKLHPAIHRSVYSAGSQTPVFRVGEMTIGVTICNDSNYPEPARLMAEQGATALFVPTNNGLPLERANVDLVKQSRMADIAKAVENSVWVIRADVAGENGKLLSYGSSGVV